MKKFLQDPDAYAAANPVAATPAASGDAPKKEEKKAADDKARLEGFSGVRLCIVPTGSCGRGRGGGDGFRPFRMRSWAEGTSAWQRKLRLIRFAICSTGQQHRFYYFPFQLPLYTSLFFNLVTSSFNYVIIFIIS